MRKLLALLVFVPAVALSEVPQSHDGRYAVDNGIILDTQSGKAWQSSAIEGGGGLKVLIPLSYLGAGETTANIKPTDKTLPDMLSNGSVKLTAEPPR